MNKRGISPLIATILLVAFSIALAAIVSTYLINQTKKFKPEAIVEDSLLCDNVAIDYSIESGSISALEYESVGSNLFLLKGLNIVNKGSFSIHKYSIIAPGVGPRDGQPAGWYSDDPNNPNVLNPNTLSCATSTTGVIFCAGPLPPGNKQEVRIGLANSADGIIKITPIIKDPEKEEPTYVKCIRNQLVLDHKKICEDLKAPLCDLPVSP